MLLSPIYLLCEFYLFSSCCFFHYKNGTLGSEKGKIVFSSQSIKKDIENREQNETKVTLVRVDGTVK